MMQIEQNQFDKDVWRLSVPGVPAMIIIWMSSEGNWFLGYERERSSQWQTRHGWRVESVYEQAGGRLSAQARALELLNSLAG